MVAGWAAWLMQADTVQAGYKLIGRNDPSIIAVVGEDIRLGNAYADELHKCEAAAVQTGKEQRCAFDVYRRTAGATGSLWEIATCHMAASAARLPGNRDGSARHAARLRRCDKRPPRTRSDRLPSVKRSYLNDAGARPDGQLGWSDSCELLGRYCRPGWFCPKDHCAVSRCYPVAELQQAASASGHCARHWRPPGGPARSRRRERAHLGLDALVVGRDASVENCGSVSHLRYALEELRVFSGLALGVGMGC